MAGAKTFDTDKLVRLMAVAIAVIMVLIVGIFAILLGGFIGGNGNNVASPSSESHVNQNSPSEQLSNAVDSVMDFIHDTIEERINPSSVKDVADVSMKDTVREIPVYGPEKANALSATNPKENGNISLGYYQVLFEKKYNYKKSMGNSSLLVDVNRGPLVVYFEVSNISVTKSTTGVVKDKEQEKKYQGNYDDKGKEIEGLPGENPSFSYAGITIIDNKTGKEVASDGFGRTYSSETKKDVSVYSVGEYLIYCTGTGLDIDVKVITGATEDNPNAIAVDTGAKDAFSSLTRSGTKTVKTGSGSTTSSNNVDDESIPPWERW